MADPVLDIFREEAREHLTRLETSFLDLEAAGTLDARRALIDELFRHAHSLKSDARVVGLDGLKHAAQALEDILDELRDHPEKVDREAIDRGLGRFDEVRKCFEAWQSGEAEEPVTAPATVPVEMPAVETPVAASRPDGKPAVDRSGKPAVPSADRAPVQSEPQPESSAALLPEEIFTVRVPSDRLDRMLSLAGEIRISQQLGNVLSEELTHLRAQLGGLLAAMDRQSPQENRQGLDTALDRLRRIEMRLRKKRSRDEVHIEALQTDIRQARLLPLVMLTDSLRRAVRDLSQALGKPLRYQADAGKIMLDKAVIEALKDPLLHLIRNAADHGIERAGQRLAAGKPEEGTIWIAASQSGPTVRIVVGDDGRGVDYAQIRNRLRQTGQAEEAELQEMSEAELARCLFRPGFSTSVGGEISGRGVGLDVVMQTVKRLHGTAELQSSSPAGTIFEITVPVTISTVRILTVVSGTQHYGIPTVAILRTGRARREDLRELSGNPVLPVDGAPARWVHLADLLGTEPSPRAKHGRMWPYLLIAHGATQTAVAVDDLEDESEVLLKPLGFPLGGLPGIVGATLRADGSIQLVLDLQSAILPAAKPRTAAPREDKRPRERILVVDDSPTTRAVLRNVFTAAGYTVATAIDGLDALDRLKSQPVALVVSDVEMPRLNGFDLTRQIKSRFGLPVILVTGREKEEHRRKGLEAGADAYVVKSTFQGEGLLDVVRQFV